MKPVVDCPECRAINNWEIKNERMKTVKSYLSIFTGIAAVICLHACKKDNYAPPSVQFTGRIVYQGTPFGVKNNKGNNVNHPHGIPAV